MADLPTKRILSASVSVLNTSRRWGCIQKERGPQPSWAFRGNPIRWERLAEGARATKRLRRFFDDEYDFFLRQFSSGRNEVYLHYPESKPLSPNSGAHPSAALILRHCEYHLGSQANWGLTMGYARRGDAERLATLPMTWVGAAGAGKRLRSSEVTDLALYHPLCFFREAGPALDKAATAWRPAFVATSLQSLWAGVAAGLDITLRTSAGIPRQLKRLDGKYGLPPLPRVDVFLHVGGDSESAMR